MQDFSPETQAAFRELFAAIEKQYGPIESVHFCPSFEDSTEFQRLAQEEPPKTASDFDYIYYPDGTCGVCASRKSGVVLAYDEFSPEGATWFCDGCWEDLGIVQPMFTIVEERNKP